MSYLNLALAFQNDMHRIAILSFPVQIETEVPSHTSVTPSVHYGVVGGDLRRQNHALDRVEVVHSQRVRIIQMELARALHAFLYGGVGTPQFREDNGGKV